jgi:hypothetical protein
MSYATDMDAEIARALAHTHPILYRLLVELVRRGAPKAAIMARVERVTRGTLTANAIETTIDHLIRNRI